VGEHCPSDPAIAHRGEGRLVAHADREGHVGEVALDGCLRSVRVAEGDARVPRSCGTVLARAVAHRGCLLIGNKRSAERGVPDENASAQASRAVPRDRNAIENSGRPKVRQWDPGWPAWQQDTIGSVILRCSSRRTKWMVIMPPEVITARANSVSVAGISLVATGSPLNCPSGVSRLLLVDLGESLPSRG
jgi:hypothetical protein